MSQEDIPIITIDGPSGSGKGTVGRLLAKEFNWHFLDSGILYRLLALKVMKTGIDANNIDSILGLSNNLNFEFQEKDGDFKVFLDGEIVNDQIREQECSAMASQLAVLPKVRVSLIELQRSFRKFPGLVTDGRDMGTVIFPDAKLKIFLTASPKERARRRSLQLHYRKISDSFEVVLQDLKRRDVRDEKRAASPLKPAQDAEIIDTTKLSVSQVLNKIIAIYKGVHVK